MGSLGEWPNSRWKGEKPVKSHLEQLYEKINLLRASFQFDFCLSVRVFSICSNVRLNLSTCSFPWGWSLSRQHHYTFWVGWAADLQIPLLGHGEFWLENQTWGGNHWIDNHPQFLLILRLWHRPGQTGWSDLR